MIGQTAAMHPHILTQAVDYSDELKRLRRERLGLKVVTEEQSATSQGEEEAQVKRGFQRFVDYIAKKPTLAQKKTTVEVVAKRQMLAKRDAAYLQTRDFEEDRKGSGLQLNCRI